MNPYTVTQLTYADQHLTRAIAALEAAGEPEALGIDLGLRKGIADRIKQLSAALPESSGIRRADALYGTAKPRTPRDPTNGTPEAIAPPSESSRNSAREGDGDGWRIGEDLPPGGVAEASKQVQDGRAL